MKESNYSCHFDTMKFKNCLPVQVTVEYNAQKAKLCYIFHI